MRWNPAFCMRNFRLFSLSPVAVCFSIVVVLAVSYIGLIATVMSYAALTVEFSQSVKNDGAAIALLESQYLVAVEHITNTDYVTEGYAAPRSEVFVPAKSTTALR